MTSMQREMSVLILAPTPFASDLPQFFVYDIRAKRRATAGAHRYLFFGREARGVGESARIQTNQRGAGHPDATPCAVVLCAGSSALCSSRNGHLLIHYPAAASDTTTNGR
jgi:hypothetical protein